MMEEKEIYKQAIDKWGLLLQLVMVIEEQSELIKEICKYIRGRENVEAISEEQADVTIMLGQLNFMFDNVELVQNIKKQKLERLEKMVSEVNNE